MTGKERDRQANEDDDNLAQKKLDREMDDFAKKRDRSRLHTLMYLVHLMSVEIQRSRAEIRKLKQILS